MKFELLNVFTRDGAGGNQLAVVYPERTLSDLEMMAITSDFGFSETVFIINDLYLRIMSPGGELPFAGHPTVGAAWSVGQKTKQAAFTLSALKGDLSCKSGISEAEVLFPGGVTIDDYAGDFDQLLRQTGLSHQDIHRSQVRTVNSGPSFVIIPVISHEVLKRALPVNTLVDRQKPYLVFRESKTVFHVRMFSPLLNKGEDAATGSAACALAGYLREVTGEMENEVKIFQGAEIQRPSQIGLSWDDRHIRIKGDVTLWGEGELSRKDAEPK